MKLQSTFTVTCHKNCGFGFGCSDENEAMETLLNHICEYHPALFARLSKEGRKYAMSQNGRAYFDDGKQKSGGWWESTSTFRQAWTKHALKRLLTK